MKGWRTMSFAAFTALIGVLAMPEVQAVIPREWLPHILVVVAIGNAILRTVTTTPMGKKE